MESDPISEIIKQATKRPAVISSTREQISYDELERNEQIVETEKGKYRITTTVMQVVTKTVVVREFDPALNYQDAIDEIVDKD